MLRQKMSKGVHFLMKKNKIKVYDGFGRIKHDKTVEITNDKESFEISAKIYNCFNWCKIKRYRVFEKDGEKNIWL